MTKLNQSYIGLRKDLLTFISGESNNVLDVGCAIGSNGKYLLENNFADNVYGIEFDKVMAQKASNCLTKVFVGDLNNQDFLKVILENNIKYDYIIFGDVLEHLINPKKVLNHLKNALKPNGKIIISLPNIAHVELFIQVFIKGTWPQNERGIFDKTHLRWFTKNDVFKLVTDTNLKIVEYKRKFRSRDAIGSKMSLFYKIIKFLRKDLVTFQHIIVCEHE
ncbi:class I SAM-dependent methyltransferase [Tenacibaculum aquimarinum]|uniref:class I SAM-dependent methyltransferase n=1 Tax=Tenacibaculum aquimarinum TaxID=2910675 RepID=UPI001F0B4E0B|nr:class I SAM-dependent methyltransferase [Tenacibaculum aquimarinum]MCH3884980.1 class I SAM-dependent methyltransferase [Tenacibaculum aquimarinum]